MSAASLQWIFLLLFITNEGAKADFCPDKLAVGKCFDEKLFPMVFGTIVIGFVFGISIVSFGLFLFCKTKVKEETKLPWLHEREPTNWLRDCQDIGIDNRVRKFEEREPNMDERNPQHFVSDQSLYSERETVLPPSENGHIMDAFDGLHEENYPKTSAYYWAPSRANENEAKHRDDVTGRNHKAQVFIGEKSGANIRDDVSSENESI